MILKKKIAEGKWVKFEGKVEFLIRPFKFSKLNIELSDTIEILVEKFLYCVVDWKGIYEEDNKTVAKCTKDSKMFVFDYYSKEREFVINTIVKNEGLEVEEVKN